MWQMLLLKARSNQLGLWQPQGLSWSVSLHNYSPLLTRWLGCSTLDLASPLELFIHSAHKHLLNGYATRSSNSEQCCKGTVYWVFYT